MNFPFSLKNKQHSGSAASPATLPAFSLREKEGKQLEVVGTTFIPEGDHASSKSTNESSEIPNKELGSQTRF